MLTPLQNVTMEFGHVEFDDLFAGLRARRLAGQERPGLIQ
jgi:hypothetical protein